ncbi:MAG: response regulator, partial [Planctomycetes bacterium]|nr:response regulator [Planctomycetota bacterium]
MTMPNGRIMIVEDESLVAEDLEVCLSRSGYEIVGVADTFESARALAERTRPDLALLDIRLKGARDGIDLAAELRRRDIGFVYLTSHSDEGTLARAEVTEPLGYVLKPFGLREISPVLKTALYRHAAEVRQRNLEHWLATTLRSIGDGVIVTDLERRVTYMNPVAEALTRRSLRQASGVGLAEVLAVTTAATGKAVPCVAERALALRSVVTFDGEVVLRRADGTDVPVEDSAAPIVDADGKVSGVVIVFR